jgi:hypothetical protein
MKEEYRLNRLKRKTNKKKFLNLGLIWRYKDLERTRSMSHSEGWERMEDIQTDWGYHLWGFGTTKESITTGEFCQALRWLMTKQEKESVTWLWNRSIKLINLSDQMIKFVLLKVRNKLNDKKLTEMQVIKFLYLGN